MKRIWTKIVVSILLSLCFIVSLSEMSHAQTSFNKHIIESDFESASGVYACDIDNDGDNDIVATSLKNNEVAWWRNDGGDPLCWTKFTIGSNFVGAIYVFAADVDGDSDFDVLATAAQSGQVAWWRNDGGEPVSWTMEIIGENFTNAHGIFAIDLDGDEDVDVLATSEGGHKVNWWENGSASGDGSSWIEHTVDDNFPNSQTVHAVDVDGDGDVDVIAGSSSAHEIVWWRNEGGNPLEFTRFRIASSFQLPHWVYGCDVDNDGRTDVLGAGFTAAEIAWWRNNGGNPVEWTKYSIGRDFGGALTVHAEDMDNDGDKDVIATAWGIDDVALWRNDGGDPVVWTKQIIDDRYNGAWPIFASDLDGDCDMDILAGADVLTGAGPSAEITWWENSHYAIQFQADCNSGHAPLTIQFQDLSSAVETINSWQWDFDNDGTIDSQEKNPAWTYEAPGSYSVKLIVASDSSSKTIVYENYIRVFDGNSGVLFDGLDGCILCPASPSLNLTETFTIEAWIHPKGFGEAPGIGFGRIVDKQKVALYLVGSSPAFNDNSLALQLIPANGSPSISTTPANSITLDTWQHVAVSYDAQTSEVTMYINGELQAITQTVAPSGNIGDNSSANLCIGNIESKNFTFDGALDEVRIWNIVQSGDMIQTNMNLQFIANKNGMVACWGLNEGFGDSVSDISDNGNNGTVVDGQWIQGVSLTTTQLSDSKKNSIPNEFRLFENYPNPFNPETQISYYLPEACRVQLHIYNVNGSLVKTLVHAQRNSGFQKSVWNGTDSFGNKVCSGIYFYKLTVSSRASEVKKMVLVK